MLMLLSLAGPATGATSTASASTQSYEPGTIIPGRGLSEVGVGDTREAVIKQLGEPEPEKSTDDWLVYRKSLGLDFLIRKGKVTEMRFNPGYPGPTTHGVALGDSLREMARESGADKVIKFINDRDISIKSAPGWSVILRGCNIKIMQNTEGILYWIGSDRKVIQIVVYSECPEPGKPTGKRDSQDS